MILVIIVRQPSAWQAIVCVCSGVELKGIKVQNGINWLGFTSREMFTSTVASILIVNKWLGEVFSAKTNKKKIALHENCVTKKSEKKKAKSNWTYTERGRR